jgi:hypothetical protein
VSDVHTAPNMLLGGAAKQLLPRRVSDYGPFEDGPELEDTERVLLVRRVLLEWLVGVRKSHGGRG